MAKGKGSGQVGNALPLETTAARVMTQTTSTNDQLTITLCSGVTSTAGGQGLVVRRTQTAGTSGGTELFVTEYDGVRGRRHVETLSTVSTAITLSATQSGSFILLKGYADAALITLPTNEQGLWYEFFVKENGTSAPIVISGATGDQMVVFGDSAADSWVFGKGGTASGTQAGNSVRIHSDGSRWLVVPQPGWTSAAPTSLTMTEVAFVT